MEVTRSLTSSSSSEMASMKHKRQTMRQSPDQLEATDVVEGSSVTWKGGFLKAMGEEKRLIKG